MGLFEMNAAAEIIHGVAHQDANIIFGTVIDDEMGDEVKVTVIAAGFDRLDGAGSSAGRRQVADARSPSCSPRTRPTRSTPTTTTTSTSRRSCADGRRASPTVAADLAAARARIAAAGGADVELLAVTKGFGPDAVAAAAAAGLRGDRRELRPGAGRPRPTAVAAAGVAVHFIGQLQTNKVRSLAGARRRVGDASTGRRSSTRWPAGRRARPCSSRSTPPASRARAAARSTTSPALVEQARAAGLGVDGLMTVGPTERRPGGGPARLPRRAPRWSTSSACATCSMGMSDDLEVAVEEGATRGARWAPPCSALAARARGASAAF